MAPSVLLVDGRRVDPGAPAVAADDPGLLGHGVYESLRTYGGLPFMAGRHLERLARGAERLGLPLDADALARELHDAVAAAPDAGVAGEITVRVVLTAAGRRVVHAMPLLVRPPTVTAVTLPWPRPVHGPLEGIKAASTAGVLVARRHVAGAEADDGIWLTPDGHVSEALAANLFAVVGGQLVTPPLSDGPLPGVTRGVLLELGAEERSLTVDDLLGADEAFLAATSHPARALVGLDGTPIADGAAGRVTRELPARVEALAAAQAERRPTRSSR